MSDNRPAEDWDPQASEVRRDPHAAYAELRQRCPVAHSHRWGGFWTLTRYEDIVNVTVDPQTFINSVQNVVPAVGFGKRIPLHADPPAHTHYRRILTPPFRRERAAALEPTVRRLVVSLLEPLIARDRGDVVKEFTYFLPVRVLCAFLHIPQADAADLKERSERYADALHRGDYETLKQESDALYAHARRVVAARKEAPLDPEEDVTSALLAAEIDGEPLDEALIVGCVRQLLVAGHLTLTLSIASAVLHLARDQDLQQRLRREPARIADAVEEFLRLYPPNRAFARTATRPVEIRGQTIEVDEPIALLWPAANRDPDVFDSPDEFDLDRSPNRHLSFGHGTHKCLGAPLARLEMRVALEELLARTETFELDGPITYADWPEFGPRKLPIRLVPAGNGGGE